MESEDYSSTITITFCECGENHRGMQMIGEKAEVGEGFGLEDLQAVCRWCKLNGVEYEFWDLSTPESGLDPKVIDKVPKAYIFVMRNCIESILDEKTTTGRSVTDELYNSLDVLDWDKKFLSYGDVKNKNIRHNLVFADIVQEPDYENKKGRIVNYEDVPLLQKVREALPNVFGQKAENMIGEGNKYHNPGKSGIGWHGDTERRRVIGLRLGRSLNLKYKWYYRNSPVSDEMEFIFNHGDVYCMSEWAVGTSWKSSSIYTLRHCAGNATTGKEF